MNEIKVSVIIPVYNTGKYLNKCLESVINQTFKNIEIIIINDCSTDNSLQIIKEYQQKDDRIVLVDLKENISGLARTEGLKKAKGTYITFIDSDDWITNNFIEILYKEIENSNLDMVGASAHLYDNLSQNIINRRNIPADTLNKATNDKLLFLQENTFIVPVWTKLYKKDFLQNNHIYFKISCNEDNLFTFEVLINTKKIKFIDDKIYYYRINRKNSFMEKICKNFTYFELFEKAKQTLIEQNKYDKYKKIYYQYISLLTAWKLLILNSKIPELTLHFNKFKKLYYNNEFINNFRIKNAPFKFKIMLILFYLCLKFNINYVVVAKFCKKVNFIKKLKNLMNH